MSKLHALQVRRGRGLPMPLPPVPKRPLGPPVILCWGGAPIWMRSDIERAGRTWDEFLDAMAEEQADALSLPQFGRYMIGRGVDAVRKLTPAHERASVGAQARAGAPRARGRPVGKAKDRPNDSVEGVRRRVVIRPWAPGINRVEMRS